MKISFGNIPQNWSEENVEKVFSAFGKSESIQIKKDKKLGVSLGYGSLEMEDGAAKKAIAELNGKEFEGKKIAVVDANELQREQEQKNKGKASASTGKIQGSKSVGGFSGTTVPRRSGGGGRGK
jgi:RNA recognition motif-containing protein